MRHTARVDLQIGSRLRALAARLGASDAGSKLERWRSSATGALSPVRRRVERLRAPLDARVAKRWRGVAYDDGRVRVEHLGSDEAALVLRAYFWPTGTRRIPLVDIEGLREWPVTGAGAYQLHGPGRGRRWYPRDARRPERDWGLVLELQDGRRGVITPDDPVRVRELLVAHSGG